MAIDKPMTDTLHDILKRLAAGQVDADEAERLIEAASVESLGHATIDHDRARRCGAAEVVFAAGKTAEQVVDILKAVRQRHPAALATRCTSAQLDAIETAFAGDAIDVGRRSGAVLVGQPAAADDAAGLIAVITAGTSDEPVAEEAVLTCKALGARFVRINDVGVAGLHRLGRRLPELRAARVIVCIAGMEGALPSVVAGLVDVPVVAVPTSVGYGASFGGIAALLGMLNSCAAGVVTVNIDNGFGGAFAAWQISRADKSATAP